jgi:hypothetical protein
VSAYMSEQSQTYLQKLAEDALTKAQNLEDLGQVG